MEQLEILDLEDNKLVNLKAGTFKQLKSLERLDIHSCGITTFPNGLFEGLDRLIILNLASNPIPLIKSNAFIDLKLLKELYLFGLADNLVLEDGVFSSLDNLKCLILNNNKGINHNHLKSNLFIGLKSLKELFIQECNIKSIDTDCFSQLQMIQHIYLFGNSIDKLDAACFTELKQLKVLYLDKVQQQTFNNGENVQEKFQRRLRNAINENLEIIFC